MFKIKHVFFLLMIAVAFKSYDVYFNNDSEFEDVISFLSKNKKMQKELKIAKYKKDKYRAFAMALDDDGRYAYWYTYAMHNQEAANITALKNCNKGSKRFNLDKECKLFNKVFLRI